MQTQGHGAPNWRQSLFWFQFLHEVQADGRSSPPDFPTLIRKLFAVKQNLTCISYSNVAWKQRDPIPTTEETTKTTKETTLLIPFLLNTLFVNLCHGQPSKTIYSVWKTQSS